MKFVKGLKLLFVLLVTTVLLSSCARQTTITNDRFNEVVNSHSDILNTRRSEMYFVSSPPAIRLDLYLNADSYSSEAVKRASNDLLNFLIDDVEKILEDLGGGSIHRITINFIIRNVGRGDENFHQVWIETRDRAKGEWEITYYWRD